MFFCCLYLTTQTSAYMATASILNERNAQNEDIYILTTASSSVESEYATIGFPEDVISSAQDDQESITKAV